MPVTISKSWPRRHVLHTEAREAHPRRWARHTRNWTPVTSFTLNPEREPVVSAAVQSEIKAAAVA